MINTMHNFMLASVIAMSVGSVNAADKDTVFGGKVTGTVKFATDYVFRGESETLDGDVPVVQGTLGWGHDSGWYTGVFASNIKFADPNLEIVTAPYVGKAGTFARSEITYDVMVFSYLYPGASYSNYTELWIKVGKQFGQANMTLEITPTVDDWFGVDGWRGINYAAHPSYAFSNGIKLSGSLGYQELDGEGADGWTHWNLGLEASYIGLIFDLRYHGSSVDESHPVYGAQTKIFDDRVVFGLSKSF